MKEFLGNDFLLDSEAAKELYYGYAAKSLSLTLTP